MKTFDRKDIFTIATIEGARKYINCEGYFCDSYYLDLNRWDKGILKQVNADTTDYPFYLKPRNNCSNASFGFRFFIPVDKVNKVKEEKEKKWRAFKRLDEFVDTLDIELGQSIMLRNKHTPRERILVVFTGYRKFDNELSYIMLGSLECSTATLYNSYEVFNNITKRWQPFGVLENES